MKTAVICFSDAGAALAERICSFLRLPLSAVHSIEKYAAKYGFTPGKVSTTLHRTRGKLQAYLREEGLC